MKGVRPATKPLKDVDEAIRELKSGQKKQGPDYRENSLRLHGHLCARCGKEFAASELYLLTVHHKDGNSHNNPPDGSNWENLCAYCHEAEHSRELLGDYEGGRNSTVDAGTQAPRAKMGTFADLLGKVSKK